MFVFEILIYVFFAWVMYSLARKSNDLYPDSDRIDRYLVMYILFFTVISAIRWRVGVDSVTYIGIFRNGEVRDGSKEYIWDWLVEFVYNNGLHFVVGTCVAAFLQIFFLTRSVNNYKYILIWLPVVLFGGRYYLDLMNGVRQMIVACGFLFLTRYIVGKIPVLYFFGILLLSLIHHSALILMPLYFLAYVPYEKIGMADKRFICLVLLGICVVVGQTPMFSNLTSYITPLLVSAGYENYSEWYANVLMGHGSEQLSFGPMMLSYLLTSGVVIWYAPTLYRVYANAIPCFNLWYFLSFIYSCGYFLVCNISHIIIRPFKYFELFGLVMLCLLLNYFYNNYIRYRTEFICLVMVIWLNISVNVYKSCGKLLEFVLYKTIFNPIFQ